MNSLDKDGIVDKADALMEVYNKLRPGEPATINGAKSLLVAKFFDERRYDLAAAGRYKLNKKLSVLERIHGLFLAEAIKDAKGKVVIAKDTQLIGSD
jgi:DNA-directed RNA polymerase subunit beta